MQLTEPTAARGLIPRAVLFLAEVVRELVFYLAGRRIQEQLVGALFMKVEHVS